MHVSEQAARKPRLLNHKRINRKFTPNAIIRVLSELRAP
jgi:hypothetical protein